METIESQVAKIELGNIKHANSFVYLMAEKSSFGNTELYVIAELPLLNPAAKEACENICLAISSTLKRSFKKSSDENAFETAISQVNEELGKLAETGQTIWIDKLNCILAAKNGSSFWITSCGKISAFLFRGDEFTDISCSISKPHPLKTFENVAFGKVKLGDILILSTNQLFNHIGVDKLRNIFQNNGFLTATQQIIDTLTNNAGPEVSFATILNQQVPVGQAIEEEVLPKSTNKFLKTPLVPKFSDILNKLKSLISFKGVSFNSVKNVGSKGKYIINKVGSSIKSTSKDLSLQQIQKFSKTKKIFLISALVLILAVALELGVSMHLKKSKVAKSQVSDRLHSIQDLVNNAQAAILYKDNQTAGNFAAQAQSQLPQQNEVDTADKPLYNQIQGQLSDLRQKLENTFEPKVTKIGSTGPGSFITKLGNFIITQVGTTIVSYDTTSGSVSDSLFLSSQKIISAVFLKGNNAIIYNGSEILAWDFQKKLFSPPFSSSVPNKENLVGFKFYPTNSRVYTINKETNQIISFAAGASGVSKPVIASKNANDLANAVDLAIDGAIYVLNTNGVTKYQSGSLTDFHLPPLFVSYSGKGKIATEINWKNIYILDTGNNRVLVIDKKGNLVSTIKSKEFSDLKDFVVDEPNKIVYILDGSSLLKFPLQ